MEFDAKNNDNQWDRAGDDETNKIYDFQTFESLRKGMQQSLQDIKRLRHG